MYKNKKMVWELDNLTRLHRDTLKEVASIGANAASTSLSKLTNKFIIVELSNLTVVSVKYIPQIYEGKSNVGILFNVDGDLGGVMISLATKESVHMICDLVLGKKLGTTTEMNPSDVDLIKEVGNGILLRMK